MDKALLKKLTILYTLSIFLVSIIPIPKLPFPEFALFEWDKFFHLCTYLIMTITWIWLGFLETSRFRWNYIKIVIFVAIITEFFQGFLPIGRYFEIADIIANMTGILIGIFLGKSFILKNKQP